MTITDVVAALALPDNCRVDKRVPKKLLFEQGAPTTGDKRLIQDGIEELAWIAALKPTNIGVPAYRDEVREYLEIAILTGIFYSEARAARLIELIHRAVPYPVVLITMQAGTLSVSLVHKRFSQAGAKAVILEGAIETTLLTPKTPFKNDFLASIAVAAQPASNLYSVYQGWFDQIGTLSVAQVSWRYAAAKSPEAVEARRAALALYARHQNELTVLRAQATKEKQIKRRVDINLKIRRLVNELGKLAEEL